MFSREILLQHQVPLLHLKKKDHLFREGQKAVSLFYMTSGEIKIYNVDSEGKEFMISKTTEGMFLGEPPFLLGERYPANAEIASETAEIFSFGEEDFKNFMISEPELLLLFTKSIARKAYDKTIKLISIVHLSPNERIHNFLRNHKNAMGLDPDSKTLIDVTRKEIANSTGLAIETVIRTVKKMERDNKLELINHKIYF